MHLSELGYNDSYTGINSNVLCTLKTVTKINLYIDIECTHVFISKLDVINFKGQIRENHYVFV